MTLLDRRLSKLEMIVGPPPGGDPGDWEQHPEKLAFFAVMLLDWGDEGKRETFECIDETCGPVGMNFGAKYLNELQTAGREVVLLFDPAHCDGDARQFTSDDCKGTAPSSPERMEAIKEFDARTLPDFDERFLYFWRDCRAGQFLREVDHGHE